MAIEIIAGKGAGAALSALSKTKAGAAFLARLGRVAEKTGELAKLAKLKAAEIFSDEAAGLARLDVRRILLRPQFYAVLPGAPLSPELIGKFSILVGNKIGKGVTSFRVIVKELSAELGEAVKPHLKELAQSYREAMKKVGLKADENEITTIFKEWEVERAKNINDSIKISETSEISGKGYLDRQDLRRKIGQANFPNYPKHFEAKTVEEAKRISIREAQFLPQFKGNIKEIYRESIENALSNGLIVKEGGSWYFFHKFEKPIGYNLGKETQWIRVELTDNAAPSIHGHPTNLQTVRAKFPKVKGEK